MAPRDPSDPTPAIQHEETQHAESQPAEIQNIDALFAVGGLVRSRRDPSAGNPPRPRFPDATFEELRPAPAHTVTAPNGVAYVPVPAWNEELPWLWHGFSTRHGGVSTAYAAEGAPGELNLGFTADDERENVLRNRQLLAEAITGQADTPVAVLRQIHSSVVVHAGSAAQLCRGDGQITDQPGLLLAIQTADCVPVLVADRRRKVVAGFHAGWRGTVKRIVETGIGRMRMEFGSQPEDLVAAIGPCIGACCYAVGEEVLSEFESQFAYAPELFHEVYSTDAVRAKYPMLFLTQRVPGHGPAGCALHVDLAEANRRQLLDAGLAPSAIQTAGGCTSCQPTLFFSHRASQGHAGRMFSVIGIRPG